LRGPAALTAVQFLISFFDVCRTVHRNKFL